MEYELGESRGEVMERVVDRRAWGLGGSGVEMPVLPNPP